MNIEPNNNSLKNKNPNDEPPLFSNTFYDITAIGPIIKVIYVFIVSYTVIILNDKSKYSTMLYVLLFIFAIGCFLNSIKYYYTHSHCNHSTAPFLKRTMYGNIAYGTIIILFLLYGLLIKR